MRLRQLFSDVAVYGFSSIIGRLLNYFLTPLYDRVFLPQEYGVMVELYAYLAFLNVLFSWGMETSFFHFSSRGRWAVDRVFSTAWTWMAIVAGGSTLILWWNVPALADALGYGQRIALLRLALGVVLVDALTVLPYAWLRKFGYSVRFSLVRLGGIVLTIFLNILFLYLLPRWKIDGIWLPWEDSVELVFLANWVGSGFTLALLAPTLIRHFRGWDFSLANRMIRYGAPLMIAGLAGMINETADRPLLRWLLPGSLPERYYQLGIYGANYKVAILMVLFLQSFRYAAEPFFLSSAHRREGQWQFARLLLVYTGAMSSVFVGVMMNLHWIKFFIGPEGSDYHQGLGVVPIVMAAFIFLGIYYHLSVWYKHLERTSAGMWMGIAGSAVTLVANYILIPQIGIYGAAVATLLSYGTMMVVSAIWGRRHYPVPYPWKSLMLIFAIAGGVGLGMWQWRADSFLQFSVQHLVTHNLVGIFTIGVIGLITWRCYRRLLVAGAEKIGND